jgi:transposase-like protein
MPFREVSRMDERLEFVMLASVNGANVRGLCRRFGISPTTGYKWLERWRLDGLAGLDELSRRPLSSPLRSDAVTEAAVLSVRADNPPWGGRKIARRLKDLGYEAVPAASTVTAILKRHGVELGAHGGGQTAFIRFERARPNELWQMDFKGMWRWLSAACIRSPCSTTTRASQSCLRPAPTSGPRRSDSS